MEGKLETKGASQEHRDSRYQVVKVLTALAIWDYHHGEERYQRREQHVKDENYQTSTFEIAQLGGSDLPVDLRQALLTAHGEQRIAQSDEAGRDGSLRRRAA